MQGAAARCALEPGCWCHLPLPDVYDRVPLQGVAARCVWLYPLWSLGAGAAADAQWPCGLLRLVLVQGRYVTKHIPN